MPANNKLPLDPKVAGEVANHRDSTVPSCVVPRTLTITRKLTATVNFLPSGEQAHSLLETLRRSNAASNHVSEVAWQEKVFGKHALQKLAYHDVKSRFGLMAQATIYACRKVARSYTLDKRTKRAYRPLGFIAYDDRILSWKPEASEVSV